MVKRVPKGTRASRFKVPNNERVVITIDTDRTTGVLNVLSMTGGTVKMTKRQPPGTLATIGMHTVTGTITAVIEMLSHRPDNSQAFRFIQMQAEDRNKLQNALDSMKSQGLGDAKTDPLQSIKRLAKRLLPGS